MIQSSSKVTQTGDRISTGSFDTKGWYAATIPSTVVSALVNDGDDFIRDPIPPASPFAVSWWFRTVFRIPSERRGRDVGAKPVKVWYAERAQAHRAVCAPIRES